MQRPTNKQSGKAGLQSLTIVLVFSVAIAGVLLNRQSISDYWQLRGYNAPTEIVQIATQNTFTDYGRKILYVNHPQINRKADFSKHCPDATREQTIVLGCYHGGQSGIFLLDITDPRLNGVKQVTTAHEMLHAAYDRLDTDERRAIDAQLMAYYNNSLKDDRILKTIDAYKKSEPNDVVNEMHSIFGTEVGSLPAGLEQYYRKYFTNRAQVVALSAQYQAEFTSRQEKVAAADARLELLRTQIDSAKADLDTKQKDISAKQESLVALRSAGNTSAYNAGVPDYNALVAAYNNQVQQVRNLITEFNALVASRNATALEEDQLIKSLSAEVQTINN